MSPFADMRRPATPLGEDFYIRLPEEIPNARLATRSPPGIIKMLTGFRPVRLLLEGLNRRSNISCALAVNPGTSIPSVWASRAASGELAMPLYFAGTAVSVSSSDI